VTLTGTLGTQVAHQALLAAAAQVFGAGNVTDQIAIDAASSDAGVAGLGGLLAALGTGSTATAELSGGAVTLTGTVPGAAALSAAVDAAAVVAGDPAKVTSHLTVAGAAASPSLSVSPASPPTPSSPAGAEGADTVRQRLGALPEITFRTGSATLTPVDRIIVTKAAAILAANPAVAIQIEGFTDDVGDWDVNLELSRARAETVRKALIAHGIAASRLSSAGRSEERPKLPNTSAANRALNRRAELLTHPSQPR
jgi:outer membrane protein OmpA-like peptidoglycan-associated protein